MNNKRTTLSLVPALLAVLLWGGALAAQAQSTCGGIGGLKCPDGQACQYPVAKCNQPDLAGTCVAVPATCPDGGKKVCGCDGTTYDNECKLLKAGVREAKKGACTKAAQPKLSWNAADSTSKTNLCAKTGA